MAREIARREATRSNIVTGPEGPLIRPYKGEYPQTIPGVELYFADKPEVNPVFVREDAGSLSEKVAALHLRVNGILHGMHLQRAQRPHTDRTDLY